MKGSDKPKKPQKKAPQRSLKEKAEREARRGGEEVHRARLSPGKSPTLLRSLHFERVPDAPPSASSARSFKVEEV
jgi:hypothetical protein